MSNANNTLPHIGVCTVQVWKEADQLAEQDKSYANNSQKPYEICSVADRDHDQSQCLASWMQLHNDIVMFLNKHITIIISI